MTVRVGKIELPFVQAISTDEPRLLVEQRVPGRAGSFFQDLGRRAVMLEIEGLLLGEDGSASLEELRKAQADARPLAFAADIVAGIDFTDVLIESLRVRQIAGYRDRYRYAVTLREHVEEPEPPAVSAAAVDAGVDADAASFAAGALDASAALQDVTALPELAAANPAMLDHLSTDDLTGAISDAAGGLTGGGLAGIVDAVGGPSGPFGDVVSKLKDVKLQDVVAAYEAIKDPSKLPGLLNAGVLERLGVGDLAKGIADKANELTGGQFRDILGALQKIDPDKVVNLVSDLRNAGSLGEFMEKLAKDGIDIAKDLGIDLEAAADIVKGVAGGADFLKKLAAIGDKGAKVIDALKTFDPLAAVRSLGEGARS